MCNGIVVSSLDAASQLLLLLLPPPLPLLLLAAGCWLLLAAADDPLLRLRAKTFVHAQRADARNGHTACDVWATFSALERWVTVT